MKKRKTYLDFIRILAIFMVVYVHTGPEATQKYLVNSGDFAYWFALVLNSITQTCAPLFFMISGALLLQKKENLKDIYLKRILKFFILLMVFGLIEYAYFYYLNPEITFSLKTFFAMAYSSTIIQQYWFLYAYLAFLMILPFVRMMAQNMERVHFWYLAGLMLLLNGICPIIEYLWGNGRIAISIPLLTNIILYPLIGYYFEHVHDGKFLLIINGLGFMALITNTVIGHMAIASRGDVESLEGMTMLVAATLFIDIKVLFEKHPAKEKASKVISFIGAGSMYVFLLEPPLRDTFKPVYIALEPYITWFPAALIWVALSCTMGTVINGLFSVPSGIVRKIMKK